MLFMFFFCFASTHLRLFLYWSYFVHSISIRLPVLQAGCAEAVRQASTGKVGQIFSFCFCTSALGSLDLCVGEWIKARLRVFVKHLIHIQQIHNYRLCAMFYFSVFFHAFFSNLIFLRNNRLHYTKNWQEINAFLKGGIFSSLKVLLREFYWFVHF